MLEIKKSELVGNRADLARLADVKHLITAVEVGTDRGIFAREFLQRWHGEMLFCVDTWEAYSEMPWDRQGDLLLASAVLAPFADRVRIIRGHSGTVVKYFGHVAGFPKSIDLVYIDAAHDYESALADIRAWWPIVREGGILAGDDFDEEHAGVKQAVMQFAEENELARIDLTTDYNRGDSWYIEK